mgnify:CR=1 FL=1
MSAPHRIALDGEVTIYRAAEIRELLLTELARHPEGLEINLASVSEIDSSGVQLLMAAKRAAQAAEQTLSLVHHSDAVVDVLELFNLAGFFGDPLLVPAASPAEGAHA